MYALVMLSSLCIHYLILCKFTLREWSYSMSKLFCPLIKRGFLIEVTVWESKGLHNCPSCQLVWVGLGRAEGEQALFTDSPSLRSSGLAAAHGEESGPGPAQILPQPSTSCFAGWPQVSLPPTLVHWTPLPPNGACPLIPPSPSRPPPRALVPNPISPPSPGLI